MAGFEAAVATFDDGGEEVEEITEVVVAPAGFVGGSLDFAVELCVNEAPVLARWLGMTVAVSFVPFVFHGARDSRPEPDRLPLGDIIAANLDHYRLDADYKHGLHFTALPTAWVSGFDKAAPLRIGSSTAWVSEVPGASAGFLEFSGAGLAHLERTIERAERRMALLGARMLEATSVAASSGGSGDLCGLGPIVASLNQSLSRVLQLAQWWVEGGEVEAQTASFAMNTDLGARAMSGEEITAVVTLHDWPRSHCGAMLLGTGLVIFS